MFLNLSDKNFYFNFGYNSFGPILLCFTKWLLSELKNKKIKKVYFFSRDGLIIKNVFDIINDDKEICSYYFYASRRSIVVPSLWKCTDFYSFFDRITLPNKINLKSLLKKLGLETNEYVHIIKKYNLDINYYYDVSYLKSDKSFLSVFEDLFPLIIENSKKEYTAFKEYCKKNNFFGDVAIVDIGWHGTMQKAIEKLEIDNLNINGYYVGLIPENNTYDNKNSFGFLFDNNNGLNIYNKFKYFISIFEFLFLANHGSVKKFDNDKVVFKEYEYENKIEKEISSNIQSGAIKFVTDNKCQKISKEECIKNITLNLLYPDLKTARFFGNILFMDDEVLYIAKPKKIIHYFLNIKKLKYDFISSSWRIGFLKRIFKIPFNYYWLNELLRKIVLKEKKNEK